MKMIKKIAGVAVGLGLVGSSVFAQSLADAKKAIDAEQYQKAKTMLKNLTVTQADKDENFFYLGWVYLKQDYTDSAKAAFNKGLAVNGKSALNYAGLGAVAHIDKDNSTATSNFNQAIALAGKNGKPYVYVGRSYLFPLSGVTIGPNGPTIKPADADAAIAVLNKGKVINPKDAELLIALGDAYRSQLKSNDAYSNYASALALDPRSPVANVAIGVLWRFADNFDDSEKQFQAALTIDPNFGPAYREWAETDLRWAIKDPTKHDEKVQQAAESYKKYIALTDNSIETQMRYSDFLITAKDYVTLQKVATSLSTVKTNLRVYRYLGYAAFENKDYPAAFTALTKWTSEADAKRLIPSDYLYLGRTEMALKKDSIGIRDLRKALDLDTNQVDVYGEIGKSLYASGKYEEAGNAYRVFASKSRQAKLTDHYYEGLSYFNAFNDQSDKAVKVKTFKPDSSLLVKADTAFTYVLRKTATNPFPDAVLQLAYINDLRDPDVTNFKGLAKPYYEQYVQLITAKGNPSDAVKKRLANAYVYLGTYAELKEKDEAKALDFYTKAKEYNPDNSRVKYFFARRASGGKSK